MRRETKKDKFKKRPKIRTARQLTRLTSDITLDELRRRAAEQPPPIERKGLPLKEIHIAPRVFQWRLEDEELAADEQHVWDLVHAITCGDKPRTLDPILVTAIGTRFYVLDGHHRVDAYHTARWKGSVPVEYFRGTLKEAQTTALKCNSKNKLRMTGKSKTEAAWRMLVEGRRAQAWSRTWIEIMELTGVGRGTLQRMTDALKLADRWWASRDQQEQLGGQLIYNGTWADARRTIRGQEHQAMDEDEKADWREEKARKIADHMLKGPSLIQDPEITAMALEKVSEMLPGLLLDQWSPSATEELLTEVAENLPETAGAVKEVLAALRKLGEAPADKTALPDTAQVLGDWDSL